MGFQVWCTAVTWLLVAGGPSGVLAQHCVPLVTCRSVLEDSTANLLRQDYVCQLSDGSRGVLCQDDSKSVAPRVTGLYLLPETKSEELGPLPTRLTRPEHLLIEKLPDAETEKLVCAADTGFLKDEVAALAMAVRGDNVAKTNSPESVHLKFARPSSKRSVDVGKTGEMAARLATGLNEIGAIFNEPNPEQQASNQHFPPRPVASEAVLLTASSRLPNCTLPPEPACGPHTARYRTHDGTCNHQSQPLAGSAHTAYSRFFRADYDDGIGEPRTRGFAGAALPSARLVSTAVAEANSARGDDQFRTIGLTLFGQFVDHDLTSTPEESLPSADDSAAEGGSFQCCNQDRSFPDERKHAAACIPIRVPDDDPFFAQLGVTCMHQIRSLSAVSVDCLLRPRAQLNQITHFLDSSNLYGSSDEESVKLRSFSGGQIRTTSPGRLLPRDERACAADETVDDCFVSGDQRAGENIGLAFIHLVWTREHNRVAAALGAGHPEWDDERLYQEARRVVNAEYQHIVYNEFLPIVLGYPYTADSGLQSRSSTAYKPTSPATISSEFATAGFRFGHSMVHDVFRLEAEAGRAARDLRLRDTFFNSSYLLERGIVRQLAASLTAQLPGWVDLQFVDAIRQRLFQTAVAPGLDLIALNINRGRDHGLQSYVTAVENCLGSTVSGWDDFGHLMTAEAVSRLRSVYASYKDVDLYIGLVAEQRATDSAVGPTFQCLIGQQFFDLRSADRFFYTHSDQPNSFTAQQIGQLQLASMARILCDNVDGLEQTQQLAFFQPGYFSNARQSCSSQAIPAVDLSLF